MHYVLIYRDAPQSEAQNEPVDGPDVHVFRTVSGPGASDDTLLH